MNDGTLLEYQINTPLIRIALQGQSWHDKEVFAESSNNKTIKSHFYKKGANNLQLHGNLQIFPYFKMYKMYCKQIFSNHDLILTWSSV